MRSGASICLFLACLVVAGAPVHAQQDQSVTAQQRVREQAGQTSPGDGAQQKANEIAAIRRESEEFVAAFNRGDAPAVAALWTEDGEYIDETGRAFTGRSAIAQEYAGFFAAYPDVKIRIVIDSLRLLSDSAAIEDGRTFLEPAAGAPGAGKYTAVHVKVNGQWLMSTVRDSRVETPSAYQTVADLEWLIGTWTAEEHRAQTRSICRWVAGKTFVERSYTTTHADGTTTSGIQLIGFNPQAGRVQSWSFGSDGGHAIGIWSPRDKGWSAETHGILGNGASTTAVNLLTRLDDNAYVWQSVQRTVGGMPLPDTDEIVLKRVSTGR